jgi:hypothetical protein
MTQPIKAYPLQWPEGWKRTAPNERGYARFRRASKKDWQGNWQHQRELSINEATLRVRKELQCMGVHDDDVVISTNLVLRLDGGPRSGQSEPNDPGVAVYWQHKGNRRCIAIDQYTKVTGNLAAIAATLDAMRAIERHGGAEILDRAFTGFVALPAPERRMVDRARRRTIRDFARRRISLSQAAIATPSRPRRRRCGI